jgi:hypothetical protein
VGGTTVQATSGGAGGSSDTFGVPTGTPMNTAPSVTYNTITYLDTYYPALKPSSIYAPGGGGNGALYGLYDSGMNGGTGGLYGGGGGGGAGIGTPGGDYASGGGFGGSGAQGLVTMTIWFE